MPLAHPTKGQVIRWSMRFTEEFRKLHQSVMSKLGPEGAHVLQFTSSQFDEGVTSVCVGFSYFLGGVYGPGNVVLLEANVRRPSLGLLFRKQWEAGLQSVITGDADIGDAMIRLRQDGFSILPSERGGGGEERFSDAAGRRGLDDLIAYLRSAFAFVVIDSPPVNPFIDATALSEFADGVVFVIEANRTRSEVAGEALEKLKSGGANVLGVVLNKREYWIPEFIYRRL